MLAKSPLRNMAGMSRIRTTSVSSKVLWSYSVFGNGRIEQKLFNPCIAIIPVNAGMSSSLWMETKHNPGMLTECVHELVVALLPVGSSVGHRVAVGGGLTERSGGVVLAVAAAAVVAAPWGTSWVRGAAAAAAAHLLYHLHLCSQLCQRHRTATVNVKSWDGDASLKLYLPFLDLFV